MRRFAGTFVDAFRPLASAPRFRGESFGPALGFALVAGLPLAFASGIVPFTHHLFFGPGFAVTLHGARADIPLDVVRAGGIGVGLWLVQLAALGAPYASLSAAYGTPGSRVRALRVVLYRAWLLPFGGQGLVESVAAWAYPGTAIGDGGVLLIMALGSVPLLLLLIALRAVAMQLNGLGPFASIALLLVPLVLYGLAHGLMIEALAPWLPNLDELPTGPAPGPRVPAGPMA